MPAAALVGGGFEDRLVQLAFCLLLFCPLSGTQTRPLIAHLEDL